MRNLLNFLIKYNYWFLFVFLEVISFVLLFRFNYYQQSVFFTSANVVSGKVYEVSGGITSYFHLKTVNEGLLDRNMLLEQQISNLEKVLKDYFDLSSRVKEMHTEIFSLRGQLAQAAALQCSNKDCTQRAL